MLAKEAVIVRDALEPSISESAQRVRAALEEKGLEMLLKVWIIVIFLK